VAKHRAGRTQIVWGSLIASMTAVGALLLMSDEASIPGMPAAAMAVANQADRGEGGIRAVLSTSVSLDRERWQSIVIHDSGHTSGSPESIATDHENQGLRGLGYHFVIANGRGAPEGQVHVGYRWDQQAAGAHTTGPNAETHNRHGIGICLVGDGDRRGFSDTQLARVTELVRTLCAELDIPADQVFLHRDVAPTTSPGRLFPEAEFRASLMAGTVARMP
jgi:N-acetyl-anhydromuramyl-L-alanine amidase AmpD